MRKFYFLSASIFVITCTKAVSQVASKVWCKVGTEQSSVDSYSIPNSSLNKNLNSYNTTLIDPNEIITIPVVFHVLYHANVPAENISDQKIFEQLAILNADFRKLNSDIGLIPYGPWSNLAADFKVELKLACLDPMGNPTTGIERVATNNPNDFCGTSLPPSQNIPCPDAQLAAPIGYGADAWNSEQYLNVWVCAMEAIGGAAMFPWQRFGTVPIQGNTYQRSEFDGIILDYRTVGLNGGFPYFNKGRVGTHEAGHWFGLWHTFQGYCLGIGDEVADTPPTSTYINCPTFPNLDPQCSPVFPGTMFMNYMDYTQDDCKYMFTEAQKTRARSYFSANGPPESRYPFIQNYFNIIEFPTPHQVQNNTITVTLNNPACLPVNYTYSGPVTEIQRTNQMIVFSVPCTTGAVPLTATAVNYSDRFDFTFDNLTNCELWPKAYRCDMEETFVMTKDYSGNYFIGASQINFYPDGNYNHQGYFPPSSPINTVHFNRNGVTNWTIGNDEVPSYCFSSGVIQLNSSSSHVFRDITTGNIVFPIISLAPNERVWAESSGNFITCITSTAPNISSTLIFRTATTTISSVLINGAVPVRFNPSTNNFFFSTQTNELTVYNFNGNGFVHISTSMLPLTPPYQFFYLLQVDHLDKLYLIEHGVLKKYDYQTGILNPVTGFNNANLRPISVSGNASDNLAVYNELDYYLYYINLSNFGIRRLSCPSFNSSNLYADIDNGFMYLFGEYYSPLQIGTQNIPLLPNTSYSCLFFTKLSLQTEFESNAPVALNKGEESRDGRNIFSIKIKPNPAKVTLELFISSDEFNSSAPFKVAVANISGNVFLQKATFSRTTNIDISILKTGLYYLTVTNQEGVIRSKQFFKF